LVYFPTCGAPEGFDDMSKLPALNRALLEKGYSPQDIRKIYGATPCRLCVRWSKLRLSKDNSYHLYKNQIEIQQNRILIEVWEA
jgi:hypothetical protein